MSYPPGEVNTAILEYPQLYCPRTEFSGRVFGHLVQDQLTLDSVGDLLSGEVAGPESELSPTTSNGRVTAG
jgi:hypothetical protein